MDKQYLTKLSEKCRMSNAYDRLRILNETLVSCGEEERARKNILEAVVDYVSGIEGDLKWKSINYSLLVYQQFSLPGLADAISETITRYGKKH